MKETRIMNVFNKYVKKFDMNKGNVKTVYFHSLRMMDLCKDIASNLGIFNDEEIVVCGLIGLFHDIGSFSNKKKYIIYQDDDCSKKTLDIMFGKDKLMREITDDEKYDDVIKVSIYCQAKYGLPKGLNDKILTFCKIIKDAHSIDDFKMFANYSYMDTCIDCFPSSIVYDTFKDYNVINSKISDNSADSVLEVLSLVFGINYHYSFVLLNQEESVNKLINSLKISNENVRSFFNQIGAVINMYIDRKIAG